MRELVGVPHYSTARALMSQPRVVFVIAGGGPAPTCPPSSAYNAPCGCCVGQNPPGRQISAPPLALPFIQTLSVDCGDSSVTSPEGYTLKARLGHTLPHTADAKTHIC